MIAANDPAPDRPPAGEVAEEFTTADGRVVRVRRDPAIRVTASGMTDEEGAAAYLQCSRRTLQRYRAQKCEPRFRMIAGRVWYSVADLDDYLRTAAVYPEAS